MQKSQIRQIAGGVMLIGGVLFASYSWATTISEFPPLIKDWRLGVGVGLFLFFIGCLIIIYELYGNFLWYETDITLSSYGKDISTNESFDKLAILEVYNNEELPIKCFATLEIADDVHINEADVPSIIPLIPSVKKVGE